MSDVTDYLQTADIFVGDGWNLGGSFFKHITSSVVLEQTIYYNNRALSPKQICHLDYFESL